MTTKSIKPTTRETSATTFDRGERNLIVTIHDNLYSDDYPTPYLNINSTILSKNSDIPPFSIYSMRINVSAIYEQAVKARVASERRK